MRAGTNPEVQKLISREEAHIAETSAGLDRPFSSDRETIGALLAVLGLRQRYFALVGEHFSVFDFDGITAMDQLDERVLTSAHKILQRRPTSTVDNATEAKLKDALTSIPDLPQHPVGYMVLFQIRRIFESFDTYVQDESLTDREAALARFEKAFLNRLAHVIEAYVHSRSTPITRHFGDMAREYSVVSRMHCPCGQAKYEVRMQSLITDPSGSHLDRLEVKCGACGKAESLEFPLPFFNDLSIA